MKMSIALFGLFLLILSSTPSHAQEADLERGNSMLREAIALIDAGSWDEAWKILENGRTEFPNHSLFRYEQGYILMVQEKYGEAAKVFSEILDAPDATGQYYAMLGNAYDLNGEPEKAVETYRDGIKKYPDSGPLHLELGVMQAKLEDYDAAVATWEQGLTVAPDHPSNYYHAARMYMQSPFRGWGILYGEIFLNLEPATQRSEEIRAMLWHAYNDAIKLESGVIEEEGDALSTTETGVEFFVNAFHVEAPTDSTFLVGLPYFYETTSMAPLLGLTFAMIGGDDKESDAEEKGGSYSLLREDGMLTLRALHEFRLMFLAIWQEGEGAESYDLTLFRYQQELVDAGLFEAYNYLLMVNEETAEEMTAWMKENPDDLKRLVAWIGDHPYPIAENPFSRLTLERVEIDSEEMAESMNLNVSTEE